jgi:sec-independent protein translocase protein TatA
MLGFDNPSHIAILVVVLLLVFGARRLPEIGRSLGSGIREFKHSVTAASESTAVDAPTPPAPAEPATAEPAVTAQAPRADTRAT